MSNSAGSGSDMEPGSEDEGVGNVASPSPVASPDSNNNSESLQSPAASENDDRSGQESGREDVGDNNGEVSRDSVSEGRGDAGGDVGSGSDDEKNEGDSDAEVRSSPSSPVPEIDSGAGDQSAGEEENEKADNGRESRQSSTSGAGGEQSAVEQAHSDGGQPQDEDDEAPSCHDSPPASPSPSNTGAEERSSGPSSPIRRNSDDEKDSDREDAKEAGSDKEDEEDEKDSDKEDDDDSDNESNVGELIANIFGDSDDESEFEGFGKEDLETTKKSKDKGKKARKVLSDSEEEDEKEEKAEENVEAGSDEDEDKDMEASAQPADLEVDESEQPAPVPASEAVPDVSSSDDELEPDSRRSRSGSDFMSDFDIMMAKKKEENSRRRKRKDVDIISDTDDIIVEIIKEMKAAAEEDKELNQAKRAATKKLKLLPVVVPQLKKLDLKGAFLDQGVLHAMAEWLAPLPDKSLPHLQIREHMLRLLSEFPPLDQGFLKSSGIGRAVMYLYKHPKESKENRERAGKLINEWARPIFNLNTNYSSISKEEREQKDFERMPQKRKIRMESSEEPPSKKDIDRALTGEDKSLRPGEKGWVARARVPMPSTKDYVVRPKWNCDTEFVKNTKKTVTRLDKHMRQLQERKKKTKMQRAVTISIEGRHMSL
uniref:TFIIS N-terminal domain-containing protein n=1 Tax=Amblyomma triste TaxID=251400 RepID=A0A023GNY1_AMBTT